jgi:PAS domain S-box-containing protein
MSETPSDDLVLESAARPFLSYAFLFKSWMRSNDAKLVSDGEIMFAVNEEIGAMFGYHPSELIGKCVDVLVPESVRPRHIGLREGYKAHPKNRPMDAGRVLKARHKSGREFSVVINLLYNTEASETLIEATIRRVDD